MGRMQTRQRKLVGAYVSCSLYLFEQYHSIIIKASEHVSVIIRIDHVKQNMRAKLRSLIATKKTNFVQTLGSDE